ncbi:MAG: dihydroneopterin aldolase [Planktotalea sp.]|uniref:dihydroneopterin aldolase n=1 Tax=Planktotalea sp. TaxID=2029877 RepID=UPI003C72ECEA
MSNETRLAFAHPEERAKASASDPMLDRISLRDHIVSVEIGAFQAERGITQRLSFNIVVEVRHSSAELGDDVDLILSYDRVTEAIDLELAAERLNLLETLAERIADRILGEPQAQRVFVRIEKLDRGGGALGVEIVRTGDDAVPARAAAGENKVRPRVVFLSDAAIGALHFSAWIKQLSEMGEPLVLCVSAMEGLRAKAQTALTQSHIDLLAVEQNAWRLAGLIAGSAVVATRTEMDWAIKHDQISIWAPSKFVFDAVDAPLDLTDDPVAICLWLAEEVDALEVVLIGEDTPKAAQVACRSHPLAQERI